MEDNMENIKVSAGEMKLMEDNMENIKASAGEMKQEEAGRMLTSNEYKDLTCCIVRLYFKWLAKTFKNNPGVIKKSIQKTFFVCKN